LIESIKPLMLHHHHETTVMEDGSVRIKSGPLTAAGAASAAGSHWSESGAAAPGNGWAKLRSEARRGGEKGYALRVTGRYKSAARARQRRGGDN